MRVGLDIGSTTIKCAVLDDQDNLVFHTYERHYSHIVEKARELLLRVVREAIPAGTAKLAISGSAAWAWRKAAGCLLCRRYSPPAWPPPACARTPT